MKDELEMDFDEVPNTDFHRLPQHRLLELGKRITRPIIVKLAYTEHKTAICRVAKIFKNYNRTTRKIKHSSPYVFITYRALFKSKRRNYSLTLIKHKQSIKKLNA